MWRSWDYCEGPCDRVARGGGSRSGSGRESHAPRRGAARAMRGIQWVAAVSISATLRRGLAGRLNSSQGGTFTYGESRSLG